MTNPRLAVLLAVLCALTVVGCGADTPADERPVVGVIMVGAADDLGYNQAVHEGAQALARNLPNVDVRVVANVAEDVEVATAALEELVAEGAEVLLATSYGHLAAARRVAAAHPDVDVVHQGGVEGDPDLPNLGTYFGRHPEPVFQAGIAAGAAAAGGTIGYVLAYPIPATLANANAMLLGSRRVDPSTDIVVVFTDSWCDPERQQRAVDLMLSLDVAVLAQHQDCAETVLHAAERAGVPVVGFHADGREAALNTWLTGAVWDWGPLYTEVVATSLRGDFAGSVFDGDYRGGDTNPFVLAEPSTLVDAETRVLIDEAAEAFANGEALFQGPLTDNQGVRRLAEGESLEIEEIDAIDWFLEGIRVVELPS